MVVLVRELFSSAVRVAVGEPRPVEALLYPEELMCIARAVPKRRAEFATARVLAREALGELGGPASPILPAEDRAPRWPAGFVGSITHTTEWCAVAVARSSVVRSIGLDLESLRPLDISLWDSIMTKRERAWVESHPLADQNALALLHFSAKEAYYKCQYPLSRGFLDFLDVELDVDLVSGSFRARAQKPDWPASVSALEGRFRLAPRSVACGVELAA